LVLDEPTSGLDPLVRREFLESMVDRAADGKSVLLSSHQITEVERVADHVAILHEGKIALVATLDQLKETIQELTVTLGDHDAAPPEVPGEILRLQKRTHQWQLLVRGAPEAPGLLRGQPAIEHVETRTPSLEEIFVAYVSPEQDITEAPIGDSN
jgi:ABC-2 type transport system ATP-binding protein